MFICNHVIAGAAIGLILKDHPLLAFSAGFTSHLVLDSLPHWAVDPQRPDADAHFLKIAKVDGCTGCALFAGLVAVAPKQKSMSAAIFGSCLPDIDKPARHFLGFNPVPRRFQNFHSRIQRQAPHRLPHELAYGTIAASVVLMALLKARTSSSRESLV